ncbi:MAG: hypothetical protein A2Y71_14935, partial [Bacteroidetes bacterium RBG_13_42_15]
DAMMDAIIEHLSKIKDLRVKPRTSVEQFHGTKKTPQQIGKELEVSYILEGSFQRYGDSAMLNVRLIRANNEDLLWTNNYDRNWKNIFSVQREVAQTIARELKVVITPEEQQLIEKASTKNLTAYDFYMRGREEHMNYMNIGIIMYFQENLEALNKAGYYYLKALEYDSTFALAYTGLALIYNEKHAFSSGLNTSENYLDSTIILADKALTFDDNIAEAYDARAMYYTATGHFKEALAEYDKSLKLNPNDWLAFIGKGNIYFWEDMLQGLINLHKAANLLRGSAQFPSILRSIADLYSQAGFHEKSKEYISEAFTLDNDSVRYFDAIGKIDFYTLNYKEALKYLEKGYKIDSDNILLLGSLGSTNLFAGNYELSLKYYKKYLEKLEDRGQVSINETHRIAYAFFRNGFRKEADYYFNKQIELSENDIKNGRMYSQAKYTYYDLAAVYAFKGNKDMALKNLRIVNEKTEFPSWGLYYIKNDPLIDSIRKEPEFQKIARDLEAKYNLGHEKVRKWLEEQGKL